MTYRFLPKDALKKFQSIVLCSSNSEREGPKRTSGNIDEIDIEKIKKLLTADRSGWPIDALLRLRKIVEVASYVGKSNSSDLYAVHKLWDILRPVPHIQPLSSEHNWIEALRALRNGGNFEAACPSESGNTRESVEGRALAELRSEGFDIVVDGLGARLAPRSYALVCQKIEKLIKRAGGLHVASTALKVMKADGRFIDAQFLHARQLTHLYERSQAEIPWHFVYSLTLKHLHQPGSVADPSEILERMERLAKAFIAAASFQPHSIYESMDLSNFSLEGVIFESVSYDELVAFPQWQGMVAGELLIDLFECLNDLGLVFPEYSFDVWRIFLDALVAKARPDDFSPIHEFDLVSRGLSIDQSRYFLKAFKCPKAHLNSNYRLPSDVHLRNHTKYPIITGYSNIEVIQPRSVATRALYECFYAMPQIKGNNPDSIIGKALEALTTKVLFEGGNQITVAGSRYRGEKKGIEYEVDVVVESDEAIYFIECKKKALTARSRTGQTLNIFEDIANSIIPMVKQLARHENFLRSSGQLKFQNGYVLSQRERRIEKIAVSLFDHGSLQERSFFVPFLRKMAISQLSATSLLASKVLTDFNKELSEFQKSLSWLKDQEGSDKALHDFALSTWWFSIDQLSYLIEKAGGLESGLSLMRNVTARSGDFVFELSRASMRDPLTTAMRDVAKQLGAQAIF